MPGGIFCVENWSGDLRAGGSVVPLLEFLASSDDARLIHQRVSTPEGFGYYLGRFSRLDTYEVGYLPSDARLARQRVGRQQARDA